MSIDTHRRQTIVLVVAGVVSAGSLIAAGLTLLKAAHQQQRSQEALCLHTRTVHRSLRTLAIVERNALTEFRGDEPEAQRYIRQLDVTLAFLAGSNCKVDP